MIVDYYLVRRRELAVDELYLRGRRYEYRGGVNWRAMGALAAGIAVALLGLVIPPLRFLYDYAWFVGLAVAGGVHWALARELKFAPAR